MFMSTDPTPHESDVGRILWALARGDELLARRLAEVVEKHDVQITKADDQGVRVFWFDALAQWDGVEPSANDVATSFVHDMAYYLKRYGDAAPYVNTNESVEAVRQAFERAMATRFYERNPGRTLLSYGLRAMGIPGGDVDDMLSGLDKRNQ